MKLKVFQSDQGDCLLLSGEDGTRILADGGMRSSYREHVAAALARLQRAGEELDLLYVSHIDRDHISGILQLLDDLVEWRVCDYQRRSGNQDFPEPDRPRPPKVARLWHNAFHDQVPKNTGEIERMLAASASVLEAGSGGSELREAGHQRGLAASIPEGLELSRRASPQQLDIPVNKEFGGKLILVRENSRPVRLGSIKLTVIGPFQRQLNDLRVDWNRWLTEHGKALAELQRRMRSDAERLATGAVEDFRSGLALRAGELGDMSKVTVPNLASLMLLAEEGDRSVLLTGDGHATHILDGLEAAGRLNGTGVHLNILKVQHHGSEHNIDSEFCKRVTADHYLFCGNGAHENPDLGAVEAIIDSRLGPQGRRSTNAEAERRFKLWFNSSAEATREDKNKPHMQALEKLVAARAKRGKGRLQFAFLANHAMEIPLGSSA